MSLRSTRCDGEVYLHADDVQAAIGTSTIPFRLEPLLPQTPTPTRTKEDQEGYLWVEQESLLQLLEWYAGSGAPSEHLPGIGQVQRTLRAEKKARRAVARKHRWMVAYRQQYTCADCRQLLHPLAFDIDHVHELRDGGLDALHNLQALCSNCHARKTRAWQRTAAAQRTQTSPT